jgi:hypothetical protein
MQNFCDGTFKLKEVMLRNKEERRVVNEGEIIRFPFIVVEYSGNKKSNVNFF